MKKLVKLFGNLTQARSASHQRCAVSLLIIALVAIVGLGFIGCPTDDDGGGDDTVVIISGGSGGGTVIIGGGSKAPTITTTSLPGGTVGTAYSRTLTVTGEKPITWSIDAGSLPNGLTLSAAGLISGTPTSAGIFNFTVKATNAKGSKTRALSIAIAASGGPGAMTWTAVDNSTFGSTTNDSITSIAYGNGRFVAAGYGSYGGYYGGLMATSSDGITWTATGDRPFASSFYAIGYGNNKFVAGGSDGRMVYSSDGITWTAVTDSTFGDRPIRGIAYGIASDGAGKFVAVGYSGKMAYSTDGISWTAVADSTFGDNNIINSIAYGVAPDGAGKFVAVGGGIAYSSDGINWTAVADSPFGSDLFSIGIDAIAYGNNKFVAGGALSCEMAYSSDGITWIAVTNSTFGSTDISEIAYGNGRFVAGGRYGKMAYSSDGISWTAVADSTFGTGEYDLIRAIAYGNGRWVAGGLYGKMAYSGTTGGGTSPTVTTATLPGGTVGTAYSQTLTATGSTPITWSIGSGSLPNGLTLSAAGLISGTPTSAGTFNFTVSAENAAGGQVKPFSIVIAASGGGSTVLDGTWRRGNSARYYQIVSEGNNWVYSEGPEGSVNEYIRGTWSSTPPITAPSTGTLTLTVTHMKLDDSWQNLPPQYENVQTNTAAYSLNAAGNTLTISDAALDTPGLWGTLEGAYQKQSGGDGVFTLTGIPPEYNGKYAVLSGTYGSVDYMLYGCENYNAAAQAFTLVPVSNENVSLPMWKVDSGGNAVGYTGNDIGNVYVALYDSLTIHPGILEPIDIIYFYDIAFANGSATKDWSDK